MKQGESPGCRDAALVTGFLLGFGIALFAIGLTLINREVCQDVCQTIGITFLYAGGPVSALFGFFTDSVVAAWPLDVTMWVVVGFGAARWSSNHDRAPMGVALLILILALAYGLVLSQFVELTV